MSSSLPGSPAASVRTIDLMARLVFTWVRQQVMEQRFCGVQVSAAEQAALATGFLAGLRTRIGMHDAEAAMVAYCYALLSGEGARALSVVEELMTDYADLRFPCTGYLHGLQAARSRLAQLADVDADTDSLIEQDAAVLQRQ